MCVYERERVCVCVYVIRTEVMYPWLAQIESVPGSQPDHAVTLSLRKHGSQIAAGGGILWALFRSDGWLPPVSVQYPFVCLRIPGVFRSMRSLWRQASKPVFAVVAGHGVTC